jgi:hypothetical protein
VGSLAVVTVRGRPFAILGFTVTRGRIVEFNAIGSPERCSPDRGSVLDTQPLSCRTEAIREINSARRSGTGAGDPRLPLP